MSALAAPDGWQPMASIERATWIDALDMDIHAKLMGHALFSLVPLIADAGYTDAAYTAEHVAFRSLYEIDRQQQVHRLPERP